MADSSYAVLTCLNRTIQEGVSRDHVGFLEWRCPPVGRTSVIISVYPLYASYHSPNDFHEFAAEDTHTTFLVNYLQNKAVNC